MADSPWTYSRGDELPNLVLPWQAETAANTYTDLDLSSGYTFSLTLTPAATPTGAATLTKTTGITGAVGSVTVAWAVDDLDITEGPYVFELVATETVTGKSRTYRRGNLPTLTIR